VIGDRSVHVFYDEIMLGHNPEVDLPFIPSRVEKRVRAILQGLNFKWSYPEHPGRLAAIKAHLDKHPIPGVQFQSGAPAATYDQLARVHITSYLDHLFSLDGKRAWLDRDTTAVSPDSIKAATAAAGNAIAAVESVCKGEAQSAFALVRPPGHHAEPVRARGFCLLNNVAVAAAHAQAKLGCERVLIIDWDAHHGNGTQDIFWADPDVLVSAGFDPHRNDMAMNLTYDGFKVLTRIVQDIADTHCEGKLAFVLEGGYNLSSLAKGVHAVLEVLTGGDVPKLWEAGVKEAEEAAEFHRSAFSDDE
jgi:acetoin utilization deacetylase AcuC-like enzyme